MKQIIVNLEDEDYDYIRKFVNLNTMGILDFLKMGLTIERGDDEIWLRVNKDKYYQDFGN